MQKFLKKKAQITNSMGKHNVLGKLGEDIATNFLEKNNFKILERNWRYKRAELDIIAMDNKTMIFVEVKTRSDDRMGRPEEAVDTRKRGLMIKAAIAYMHISRHDWAIRFDIIGIVIKDDVPYIDHIQDAFFPGLG
jgi:putative endonuclease